MAAAGLLGASAKERDSLAVSAALIGHSESQPGGIVTVLALLHKYADAIERDLRRIYGVRYSDRWRFGPDGTRCLTLREIWVYIQELPDDAALVLATNDGKPRWSMTDHILADLYQVWTGKPHYARPKPKAQQKNPARMDKAARDARRRFAARRRALASQSRR